MKTVVAKTKYYNIEVDSDKNRVYMTLIGYWPNNEEVSSFLEDMKAVTEMVTSGFSVLTDISKMQTPSPEIGEMHMKAQKLFLDAGLERTVEVIPPDKPIEKMAIDRYSRAREKKKRVFGDRWSAEAWLDEVYKDDI